MGKRLNVQISIISHTLTFLCFHRELWTKSESQPNTCQVEKRSSVWRLLKWSPFVYSFPLFLGCTGEISCRLGNGAKAELLLFKLAAAPSVCTCRSATDRVTLPQKLSQFLFPFLIWSNIFISLFQLIPAITSLFSKKRDLCFSLVIFIPTVICLYSFSWISSVLIPLSSPNVFFSLLYPTSLALAHSLSVSSFRYFF